MRSRSVIQTEINLTKDIIQTFEEAIKVLKREVSNISLTSSQEETGVKQKYESDLESIQNYWKGPSARLVINGYYPNLKDNVNSHYNTNDSKRHDIEEAIKQIQKHKSKAETDLSALKKEYNNSTLA
jgi:chromosome segregation ATPase